MASAPTIVAIQYDGQAAKVWWTPSSDTNVTGYILMASSAESGIAFQSPVISGQGANFGSLSTGTLPSGIVYTLQVQPQTAGGPGTASPFLPLLAARPVLRSAWYDGANLNFSWHPIEGAVNGYQLAVYSLDSGTSAFAKVADPWAEQGVLPQSAIPGGKLDPSQQWAVRVDALSASLAGGAGLSASSDTFNLPKPLPTLNLTYAEYQGGVSIKAGWSALAQGAVSRFAIELTSPQDDSRLIVTIPGGAATQGSLPLPRPLAPLQQYAARVLALTGDDVGVATPAQAVISALSRIVRANYDGANVQLVWQAAQSPAVQSYLLKVVSLSSGQTFTATVPDQPSTSGSVATGPLDAAQDYVASVATQNPNYIGGASPTLALLAIQPAIVSLAYDGAVIEIGWTGPAGVVRYVAGLFKDGALVQSVEVENGLASSARLVMPSPLGSGNYTVGVTASTDAGTSAASALSPLPTTLPVISSVAYNGSSVVVEWAQFTGAASFTIALHSPVTGTRIQQEVSPGTATGGTLPLPGLLGTDCGYLLTLSATLTAGGTVLSTQPVPLITSIPVLGSVSYDGAAVTISWTPVADSAATVVGYTASVSVDGTNTVYSKEVNNPFAASAVIDSLPVGGLDPAQTYHAAITARADNNVAAISRQALLASSVPRPNYATCYSTRIVTGWSPVAGANSAVTGYRLTAASAQCDDAYSILIPGNAATNGVLPLARPLSPTVNYSFSIAAEVPGQSQAVVSLAPVISSLPVLARARYDGANVALTWAPSQSPAVTSQILKVISLSSGNTFTAPIANPYATSGAVTVPGGLQADQLWQAQVWAQGAVAGASDPLTLLAQRPVITAVRYFGVYVDAQWTPVIGAGVTGYTMFVTKPDGTQLAVSVLGERSAWARLALAAPFPAGGSYTVTVEAEAAQVSAASDAVTLDLAQPAISSVVYQAGAVNATWAESANAAVTGYAMLVFAPQSGQEFVQPIPDRATTSGSVALGGLLPGDETWFFSLWTQTPAGISACSAPAAILADVPAPIQVSYDGLSVSMTWTAKPDGNAVLSGFVLTVRKTSSTTPEFSKNIADPFARGGQVTAGGLGSDYVAEIRSVASSGAITVSAPVSLVTPKPFLASVAQDDGLLTATWTAVTGLSCYRLGLYDAAGSLLASAVTTGLSAAFDVALDPAQTYGARLQGISGISLGPLSDPLAVLSAAPTIDGLSYTVGTLVATWQPPTQAAGITGYIAVLFEDGLALPDTATYDGNKATFAKMLTVNVAYSVVVRPTGQGTAGPSSAPVEIVTATPRILEAAFAGSRFEAAWQSVQSQFLTGYEVEIYQGSTRIGRFDTSEAQLGVTLALTAGAAYTCRVRARAAAAVGPWSDSFPVRSSGYQYFVQVAQANVQPYLFRTLQATPANPPAQAFSIFLPEIFNTTQTNAITSGAFTLTPTNSTPYAYEMDFAVSSPVWTFDNQSIRPTLQSDYNGFLKALELVTGGLITGGLELVRAVLAAGLPLTFYETLFYRYGFDPVNGFSNLQPGMALRLDSEVFQFEGTSPSATQLSGFVQTGGGAYEVGDYLFPSGARKTGFDAFLATLQRPAVPGNTRGSGGVIDLYTTGFRRAYYRIFYPATFTGGDSPGSLSISNNMALLGCDSWTALSNATDIYLSTGSFSTVTDNISYTFFRGRVLATPLITVRVNGGAQQVSLGTTVRGLVQRTAELPVAPATSVTSLRLDRVTGNLVNAAQATLMLDPGGTDPVNLIANPYQSVLDQPDAFDLPLLGGDRLTLD
jgi:hypothetical protein